MPAPDAITCEKLAKLIGTPRCPTLLDVLLGANLAVLEEEVRERTRAGRTVAGTTGETVPRPPGLPLEDVARRGLVLRQGQGEVVKVAGMGRSGSTASTSEPAI